MYVGAGLPSPATVLFNRPIQGLLPQINRVPINVDNDNMQYEALEACQNKYDKGSDIPKILFFLQGLQWWFSGKMGTVDTQS